MTMLKKMSYWVLDCDDQHVCHSTSFEKPTCHSHSIGCQDFPQAGAGGSYTPIRSISAHTKSQANFDRTRSFSDDHSVATVRGPACRKCHLISPVCVIGLFDRSVTFSDVEVVSNQPYGITQPLSWKTAFHGLHCISECVPTCPDDVNNLQVISAAQG